MTRVVYSVRKSDRSLWANARSTKLRRRATFRSLVFSPFPQIRTLIAVKLRVCFTQMERKQQLETSDYNPPRKINERLHSPPLINESAPYPVQSYRMVVLAPREATRLIRFASTALGSVYAAISPTGISHTR